MRFCSECGSNRIVMEIPEGETLLREVCRNCGKIYYTNPRVVAGCLPVSGAQVLICRRAIEPCLGKWNLPAGFLEANETAEEGAIRETLEEAHAKVEIIRLHCLYSITHVNLVYLIFLARLSDLHFKPGIETSEVKLFKYEDIPWDEIGFTSSVFALKKYFENKDKDSVTTFIGHHTLDFH